MKFNHKQTAEAAGFKVQVSHQLFNIFCLNNDTDTIWRHAELFYTSVQRNMGGKKKEENPKKLIPFWKEIFIKYKKRHTQANALDRSTSISPWANVLL